MSLRRLLTHPHRTMEMIRYGSVGLLNAGLYFALYSAVIAAHGPYWGAALSAFLVASSVGYWLHEHFSFRGGRPTARGLGMWLCAQSGATLLNLGLLTLAIHGFHVDEIPAQLGVVAGASGGDLSARAAVDLCPRSLGGSAGDDTAVGQLTR